MPHIKAGLILMLFGMVGVFLVLVLIQYVITLMIKLDARFSKKKTGKNKPAVVQRQVPPGQMPRQEDIYLKVAVAAALHHHKIKRNAHG